MSIPLSSIRTGVRNKPPKIVIYGVGGIGKTTFAASAPSPIFLCTEDGLGSLDVSRFEVREGDPLLRSWKEILDCVATLYTEEHSYQTVVLDTIDFAEPLLWEHVCQEDGKKHIEEYGYGKGYVRAIDEARKLLDGLEALRNERDMAVILIAHNEVRSHYAPDAPEYSRYQLRLQTRLASLIHDWPDALLFAQWKVHVVQEDKGFHLKRGRGVGTGERVLYTEERPGWWAKNRYGLPAELPLSWSSFLEHLTATTEQKS